ncbi:MAG: hypothetical protein K8I03_02610 [Ignavibacteria bacterium]|nr:hypothetical protein [Ignavibacteria bacterium]
MANIIESASKPNNANNSAFNRTNNPNMEAINTTNDIEEFITLPENTFINPAVSIIARNM